MTPLRRSCLWFLAVVLLCTIAVIVTADPGAVDPTPPVTIATAPDSVPVIYEETP